MRSPMKLYADTAARRSRQLTGDLLVAGWIVLWVWLALGLRERLLRLRGPGEALERAGGSFAGALDDAGDRIGGLPVVGDDVSGALRRAGLGPGGDRGDPGPVRPGRGGDLRGPRAGPAADDRAGGAAGGDGDPVEGRRPGRDRGPGRAGAALPRPARPGLLSATGPGVSLGDRARSAGPAAGPAAPGPEAVPRNVTASRWSPRRGAPPPGCGYRSR